MTDTEDFLAHFGVKGMKWGQRKEEGGGGRPSRSERKAAKAEARWEAKVSSSFPFEVHNAAAHQMNNGGIDRLNNMPKFKGKDLSDESKPLTKEYYKTYSDMFTKALNDSVADHGGVSPTGKRKLEMSYDTDNGLSWKIKES